MMTRRLVDVVADMRVIRVALGLGVGLIAMACAGSTGSSSASVATVAAPSQESASTSSEPSAASSPSGSGATSYTTLTFGVPLTVTVAAAFASPPTDDTPGLLSWTATENDNNRVRFLVPAEVYPPDAKRPMPPAKDFVGYIKGLGDLGGVYSDTTTTTIDGVQATLFTAKSSRSLDGALGCPTVGAEQEEVCFGLQPEFALRLAVMDVKGTPLLVWARTDAQAPDAAFLGAFEVMLATVDFK
jgi:hypothetical protein